MRSMNPRRLLNLLIAVTVAAGLLSAPFAAPAIAKSHHAVVAGEAMAADMHVMAGEDHAMADDMPCCPDDGKARGCESCPLLALCSLSMPISGPALASQFI